MRRLGGGRRREIAMSLAVATVLVAIGFYLVGDQSESHRTTLRIGQQPTNTTEPVGPLANASPSALGTLPAAEAMTTTTASPGLAARHIASAPNRIEAGPTSTP